MLHRGRVVLDGDVTALRDQSEDRYLHVDVAVDPTWVDGALATVSATDAAGSRLRLRPGADAATVLDSVRAHATVRDFAVRAPRLSELFLAQVGNEAAEPEPAPERS